MSTGDNNNNNNFKQNNYLNNKIKNKNNILNVKNKLDLTIQSSSIFDNNKLQNVPLILPQNRHPSNKSKKFPENSFIPLPVSAPTASTTVMNFDLNQQHKSAYDPHAFNSMRSTNTNHSQTNPIISYIYELPYNVRKSVCDLLDADNSWRELGGNYMGFNDTQLTLISHALYRSASPTNELLTKWESSNAKVSHLFMYLSQMKHHRAMYHLLPFVNENLKQIYHNAIGNQIDDLQLIYKSQMHANPASMPLLKESNCLKHSTLKDIEQNNKPDTEQKCSNEKIVDKNVSEVELKNQTVLPEVDYLLKIDDFQISYKELVFATNNFSSDNILGSGGFGTVFIGDWKGTKVAVKKLKGLDNITQALTELRILNCCRIDNILPLYAVSLDGPEPCLVYQYMPNGSLEDRLLCKNNTKPLDWFQRAKIGEGVARALNFLHTLKGNPFVHGDVKSANILLDPMFEPKLGDFGLARQVVKNSRNENSIYTHCTVSSVNGTSVYLPAEYLRKKILSPAVDVYSYGIVVLELATGRRAFDGKKLLINSVEDECSRVQQNASINIQSNIKTSENSSANENGLELLMDKRIANITEGKHLFNYLLELGRKCAYKTKSKRPIMIQVLEYYNQCRAAERIHQLYDKMMQMKGATTRINNSRANIKYPLELKYWYEFVRKSCGTLSDIVFENFDAQVTKIIEDCLVQQIGNNESDESAFHLGLLLNSKNLSSLNNNNIAAGTTEPKLLNKKSIKPSLINRTNADLSLILSSAQCTNANETQMQTLDEDDNNNVSQLLRLVNLNPIDESNLNSGKNTDSLTKGCSEEESNQSDVLTSSNQNDYSTPFIPLLTALGFNNADIDQLIEN